MLNLLGDLKAKGLSALVITHDLSLAYYIREKAVILYRGCVVETGTSGECERQLPALIEVESDYFVACCRV